MTSQSASSNSGVDLLLAMPMDLMRLNEPRRLLHLIFGAFGRAQQRVLAATHQEEQPVLRPIEGRDEFGAVLHGKAAGRSGTDVNQPAVAAQACCHRCGHPLDRAERRANRRHGRHLAFDQRMENIVRFPEVDIRIARTGVLGFHGSRPEKAV